MADFTTYPPAQLAKLEEKLKETLLPCDLYERAAQVFVQTLYAEFSPNVVLARLFVTVPLWQLPPFNKTFVAALARAKGVSDLIHDNTPILSLVGTAGKQPAWNDRRKSQGHVGIPLCSADFIYAIPMMSRLLQELGFDLEWFDEQDLSIAERTATGLSGLFYVADAGEATDAKGRKIIAAQDFVAANDVRTVFGMGTTYIGGAFAICIVFTSETIAKDRLQSLMNLIVAFKNGTFRLANRFKWLAA